MEEQSYEEIIEQASKNANEAYKAEKAEGLKRKEELEKTEVSSNVKGWIEDEKTGRLKGKQI
jgi:hypothetical protein